MHSWKCSAIAAAVVLLAGSAGGQTAKDVLGPTPLVAVENEAPPRLIVDAPVAAELAKGRVVMQYRAEHLRIVPVFGRARFQSRRASAMFM